MLAFAGFSMVTIFMALIMLKRMTPVVALILIPVVTALLLGIAPDNVGKMALEGIRTLAPTGVMLMFAILYFGLMIDVGLFEPIVRQIVRIVEGDPLKVVVGTAALAAFVSLDGDGSTTYMITVASMLPLYKRLEMNPLNLTCVAMLASGVMNLTPWGGPLARAASALHLEPIDLFLPMIPSMVAGILVVLSIAWYLGQRERVRLNFSGTKSDSLVLPENPNSGTQAPDNFREVPGLAQGFQTEGLLPSKEFKDKTARPKLLWLNVCLTFILMICLVLGILPLPVLFMLGFCLALVINYPDMGDQRERIVAHSGNVISVVSIIFAAGVFTGILNGSGMVTAMSKAFIDFIPEAYGEQMSPIMAAASMPFTFFISNDAFYFGVLPVVAEAGTHFGVPPIELARASLIGQPVHVLSPLVPSTFLLVGLAGVDLGDHQRFSLKWAVLVCVIMGAVAMLTGSFSFGG